MFSIWELKSVFPAWNYLTGDDDVDNFKNDNNDDGDNNNNNHDSINADDDSFAATEQIGCCFATAEICSKKGSIKLVDAIGPR